MNNALVSSLQYFFELISKRAFSNINLKLQKEILSTYILTPVTPTGYLPWSRVALPPSSIVTVLNDIILNERRYIVELGSGISTVFIANLLKQWDAKFYSIDHDLIWIKKVQALLENESSEFNVEFIHAPLAMTNLGVDGSSIWYDTSVLQDKMPSSSIDLLIVDGPAGTEDDTLVRYPALGFFKEYMADRYCIMLDDINRQGEAGILRSWSTELNIAPKYADTLGILIKGEHYKVIV